MSQEESIRDLLNSGRKNRRKNGLYKSHRRGHARRAKAPKVPIPWNSNAILQPQRFDSPANQATSQS